MPDLRLSKSARFPEASQDCWSPLPTPGEEGGGGVWGWGESLGWSQLVTEFLVLFRRANFGILIPDVQTREPLSGGQVTVLKGLISTNELALMAMLHQCTDELSVSKGGLQGVGSATSADRKHLDK